MEVRVNPVDMRELRSMIGVTLSDKLRNEVIREECGVTDDVVTKIENMLRWLCRNDGWKEIDKRDLWGGFGW
jgi:hypothetical protein